MEWYHVNRRMLIYKAWYFFSISAMTITPFLSLHLKQFGMSPSRIGLLTFLRNVSVAIFTPIIGLLTDIFRCPKLVVISSGILWIMSVLTIGLLTPQPEQKSCELIRESLDYKFDQCQTKINANENHRVNDSPSAITIDYYGVDDSVHCESLNATLSSERNWMYTSESLQMVFYIFVFAFCLIETCFQTLHSIADAESVNALEEMGIDIADYGNQRAFGSLGWAITPVMYGLYITYTRESVSICGFELTIVDYHPMFWAFLVTGIITMIIMIFFKLEYKTTASPSAEPAEVKGQEVLSRLCTLPNVSVIIVLGFTGMCNGTATGYVYWHLDNIGGNELLMGIMSSCHGITEVLIGFASGTMIRQFGYFHLINLGILTFLFRFLFYALVTAPWWFMVTEIMHSLSFILTWNVTLSYLSVQIPDEYRTSLATFLNAIANGFGASIGYLLSGFLIEIYGTVNAFEIYAALCALISVMFTGVYIYTITSSKSQEFDTIWNAQDVPKHELEDCVIGVQHAAIPDYIPQYTTEYQQKDYEHDTNRYYYTSQGWNTSSSSSSQN